MVTIKDVARVSGVSFSTVSRVVNGGTGFSEETRARVEAAVAELGYRPNALARSLVKGQRSSVAVLVPSVSESFAGLILEGAEEAALEAGLLVVVGRTAGRPERAVDYLEAMRGHQAVGAVLVSTVITPELTEAFGGAGPLVSVAIDARNSTPAIAVDAYDAARDAVGYLTERGHRRIGVLAGHEDDVFTTRPRLAGYTDAMREAGLRPVITFGGFHYAAGAPGVADLLRVEPDLTAVVAFSDELGVAAINALQRLGRRVPEDVSVIGFDDTPVAQHVNPALTTVAQPLRAMGILGVRMILDPPSTDRVIVPHRIVRRESVGLPPADRARSTTRGARRHADAI